MLAKLRRAYSTPPQLPSDPLEALQTLLDTEFPDTSSTKFLTDHTLRRYLTARKNDPVKAFRQLKQTIVWQDSYKPSLLYSEHKQSIHHEAQSGKMYVLPQVDKNGRSVIIMRPGLENSSDGAGNVRYLVYTLERAARLSERHGDGKFIVVVDYFTGKISPSTSPSLSTMRETTNILQTHYPERLGGMLLFEAPSFFFGLFKLIKPFIDPVTSGKLRFLKRGQDVDAPFLDWDAIPEDYGGRLRYEFDQVSYFDQEK
ncbi:CRAL-TRIO domain-containing protein [Gracilariopsis chorda]|uniref:CRAL-TRIO domain-containing protein n=1 Tax=Gracilariopsis chorda TaxID=448386 RepID=A0A2V3IHY9_9FLOR|nr:CRAL-TRIO domain-containing protein [Gracilariopsis chorda]|eukprot:PXF41697.1 CRAL-TRIO domain-containing protein [Gracilariopsis chorda]